MSDPITEALRESGLEDLLNFEDGFNAESSSSLNSGDQAPNQSFSVNASVPRPAFAGIHGAQTISSSHNPIIIRVGSLPSQSQMIASQIPPPAQSLMTTTAAVIGANTRPTTMPLLPQNIIGANQITQHSMPSQNGRLIKFVPRGVPNQTAASIRTIPGNASAVSTGGLLMLNNPSIIPSNIRHISLPAGNRPVVQIPAPNKNSLIRLNVAQRPPVLIGRPTVVPLSAAGFVPGNPLSPNVPARVVARPNANPLAPRPLTVLHHNVISNVPRLSAATPNPMYKTIPSPPSLVFRDLSGSSAAGGCKSEDVKVRFLDPASTIFESVPPATANVKFENNVKVEAADDHGFACNAGTAMSVSSANVVKSENIIPSGKKQSNSNTEEKKSVPMTTTSEVDSGDIWAALGELAAFDGLKQEDLGKTESKVKSEPQECDKKDSIGGVAFEPQVTQSGPVNRFQGLQKVAIGEKVIIRPEFMGPQRIPLPNFQMINGNPRAFPPQMRPNSHIANLMQFNASSPMMKEEEAEEELGHAETFSEYKPQKLPFGCKHPDPVVESASLSSVETPDITYSIKLPRSCWENGLLSAVQLESITYSCQRHESRLPNGDRAGFLIGDGAGVGKGRIISGIIYENYLKGRKRALWLSVSNDLKVDAERDLYDIGATNIKVYSLNKFKYEKISSKENGRVKSGVVFATYSSLVGQSKVHNKFTTRLQQLVKWLSKEPDSVIVFDECHKAKNLFSSANKKGTKTSEKVLELQNKLRNARVIYASATGATEPQNMGYMIRLGLWGVGTPFQSFSDFVSAVERRGVGAMEMVAMEMKQRGTYIARQLSFKGVSFQVEDVELSDSFVEVYNRSVQWWVDAREKFQQASALVKLNATQNDGKKMWGQFWSSHQRFFKYLCISSKIEHCVKLANKSVKQGKAVVIGLQSTGESRMKEIMEKESATDELDDFVSTAKEVLKNLVEKYFPCYISTNSRASSPKFNLNNKRLMDSDLMSQKNKKFKKESDSSDASGSSDEEDEDESNEEENSSEESDYNPFAHGSDEDSSEEKTPEKKKPQKKKKKKKSNSSDDENEEYFEKMCDQIVKRNHSAPDTEIVEEAMVIKMKLLRAVDRLGNDLPPNALDDLINKLGGPSRVAEMTGRKGRLVSNEDGVVRYEKRNDFDASLEAINLSEKQKFMDGDKLIAIISEAASSGVSLQADRRVANQKRRVHITLELPWSADRAIQQFGRTHRSNQVSAPEYVFLISKLAGERRFASTVAKRLECLGALTHGDRRAAETRDLSQFNIDTKFGRSALDAVLKSVIGVDKPLVPPCNDEKETETFFANVRQGLVGVGILNKVSSAFSVEKDSCNITKFLNRILGMEVEMQNSLFSYFTNVLGKVILNAKKEGKWDLGILDIGSSGERVEEKDYKKYNVRVSEIKTSVILHTISVDRGLCWTDAQKLAEKHSSSDEGFYKFKGAVVPDRLLYILAVSKKDQKNEKWFEIYKPNNGKQPNLMSLKDLKKQYEKVLIPTEEVIAYWQKHYERSLEMCSHKYERGYCLKGPKCELGKRTRIYLVLSGSVLSVWTNMEQVLSKNQATKDSRLQVIRLRTSSGKRIVGVLIHSSLKEPLLQTLTGANSSGNPPPPPAAATISDSSSSSSFRAHFSSSTPDLNLLNQGAWSNGWR